MRLRIWSAMVVVALVGFGLFTVSAADDAFTATWERADRPVADGLAHRTWMWGPEPFTGTLREAYAEAPGGERAVLYYDKSRMEITDPNAPRNEWFVTNGLLATELITGRLQTGHATFEQHPPAEVNVAGDSDDPSGPTYATFTALLDAPPATPGTTITQRVNRAGEVTSDAALSAQGVTVAQVDDATGHAIATPFWQFMNAIGPVWEEGQVVEGNLFESYLFATGRPITEAYWAEVKVAGVYKDVLVQCFERRCLTWTPDNPPGWQVEAGNVGRHYYTWRYEQIAPPIPNKIVYVSPLVVTVTDTGTTEDGELRTLILTGAATGDVPGTFRAEINFTPHGSDGIGTITGGTWSVSGVRGAVSGTFLSGTVTWDEQGEEARITSIMKAVGRAGDYSILPREARLDATLDATTTPQEVSGTLTMYR